ncbi:MAG: hypothetical protein NT130_03425 [Candidatus Micrarchaeota archaeon]|nr:hypothetical protein [Candidatus Micrarchaeota archaeon]
MAKDEDRAPLKTTTQKVQLEKLKLDVNNVRFQHISGLMTDKKMEEMIWDEKDTSSLCEQIQAAKGLYEQPIINSDYVVLEGNRRIVCLRHLQKKARAGELPGISKNQFDTVICKQIPNETSVVKVALYLAAIHIRGKKPWPVFNRAKRISQLHRDYNFSYDRLSEILGMGKITVIRLVSVYEQTERYRDRYSDDKDWYHKFTYFDELYKKRGLQEFRKRQENLDKFADWIHEGKFSDVRDVRSLDKILADEDARRAFENKNSTEAMRLLEEKDPTLKSREFRQINKTIKMLSSFPRKELIKTVKDPSRIKILEKLKEEVDLLLHDVKSLEKEDDHGK